MRLILDISKPIAARLHRIRQRMEIKNDVEVIGRAVSLYEMLTEAVAQGKKVLITNESGDAEEIEIE